MQTNWSGTMGTQYPYGRIGVRAVGAEDFYYGTGVPFEIRRYAADGTLRAILRRPFEPEPVSADERAAFENAYVERIRHAGYDRRGGYSIRARVGSVSWRCPGGSSR